MKTQEKKVLKYYTEKDDKFLQEQQDIIMERIRAVTEGLIWTHEAKFEVGEALLRTLYQGRNK
jgi:hypothetical protein